MARFGFDSKSFYNDLVEYLMSLLDDLTQELYKDALSAMKMSPARSAVDIKPAKVEGTTEYSGSASTGNEFINSTIVFYAMAVIDSYGTGTSMDLSNPYLNTYRKSDLWNPLRKGTEIVGRNEGPYENIFGDRPKPVSKGAYAGREVPMANNIIPSYAIQNMEKRIKAKVERRIKQFADQFIAENAHKYFRSGD